MSAKAHPSKPATPAPAPGQALDPKELRRTLGTFATGVTVVTTRAVDGTPVGLTVNSFSSLSLDPPLVLWSLVSTSNSAAAFREATHFAINILSDQQVEVSQRFASKVQNKFGAVEVGEGVGGSPLITGCAAWFECSTESMQEAGDHILFIGRVQRFSRADRKPLIFCGGKYLFVDGETDASYLSFGWGG